MAETQENPNTEDNPDEITDPLAEGEGTDGKGESEGGKGLNAKKIILFVVLPLLIISGGITTAYFMGYLNSLLGIEVNCEEVTADDPEYDECQEKLAEQAGLEGATPGLYYAIPDMRVNLNTTGSKQQFLFLVVQLELPNQETLAQVEQYTPRIIDHFQTYLRELRVEDLKGSSGLYRLRLELLDRVNAAAPELEVRDVLFQEMLVQ